MRKYLINIIFIFIILLIITNIPNRVNASENTYIKIAESMDGSGGGGGSGSAGEINTGSYKPTISNNFGSFSFISS